ncbi:multicopper oxidase domain-containing protein [Nocardiopsis sp. RSe5-2]|uniref:Multicopper oxidase domain-containing protein n=1 Tax=Nocardiopsis endophytica TaxID=3018445 RepID=A0ABT4UF70_9ACTN|nr:O-aminophenol oxidase PhsA [Nocardiopsis endophytica]MDA2814992.1 multicopper oxidase domain-containing protein [Nocardiopsis endophytica]
MSELLEKTTGPVEPLDGEAGTGAERCAGLTPFLDPLRIPPRLAPTEREGREGVTVELRDTWVRLHSQLPPTRVWTYDGHFPGPTIEARRGRPLRIAWTNRIGGGYPVVAAEEPREDGAPPPTNTPGRGPKAETVEGVDALPPWIVTHLHGAATPAGNDGWAQNAVLPGRSMLAEYPNEQRSMTLWYHDHAMDITRWNVYTGLHGLYLLRDGEEDALGLPSGAHEVPLIITDRNIDTDGEGRLTGRLLHKTQIVGQDAEGVNVTLPFTGPYTLVNGVIWPYFEAEARWYRFRLLNASNARTYRFSLIDEDTGEDVGRAIRQIGTEGGLMARPARVRDPLEVAPAERADLLMDLSRLRGRTLRLVNVPRGAEPGEADPDGGIPFPQVMQIRVGEERVEDGFVLPPVLSSFRRITHDNAPEHGHRLIVLTPPGTVGGGGHPEMWEMVETDPAEVQVPSDGVIQVLREGEEEPRTYRRVSRAFDDALGFIVELGDWEQWSFLNLADPAPMHPMHIHLITFQALGRRIFDVSGFDPQVGGTRAPVVQTGSVPVPELEHGWKDVIRVPAAQMADVIGPFEGATGRFMHHCHLLEHEDMGMMLPFVVRPPELTRFDHGAGGHTGDH